MNDDDLMNEEFKIEAAEMFENAEEGFLNIDKGLDFNVNYNSIFRALHSLKGAAGMFGINDLQAHMHKIETLFELQKKHGGMKKNQIDYFLRGIDAAKFILNGTGSDFVHVDPERFNAESSENISFVEKEENLKEVPVKNKIQTKIGNEKNNGTVFVVDDEKEIADDIGSILEKNGIIVHKFYDTKTLLESFESIRPDAIISDIVMPNLNGLGMLEAIRDISTDTPVIFISAHISKDVMLEALKNGAYDFIEKPYDDIKILSTCNNAIKKNKALTLLDKSINYILYQFSNLDQYLKDQGKENVRLSLKAELETILEQKKILKSL